MLRMKDILFVNNAGGLSLRHLAWNRGNFTLKGPYGIERKSFNYNVNHGGGVSFE